MVFAGKRKKLLHCAPGTRGKFVELQVKDRKILAKMMSLGIIPGAEFRLLRKKPGVLVETGHTIIALDRLLAASIRVEAKM